MTENIGDDLITYARRWAPFGGPSSDDLLVEFGMTSRTYYNRLARVLRTRPATEIGEDIRHQLLALCYHREPFSSEFESSTPTITTATAQFALHVLRRDEEENVSC